MEKVSYLLCYWQIKLMQSKLHLISQAKATLSGLLQLQFYLIEKQVRQKQDYIVRHTHGMFFDITAAFLKKITCVLEVANSVHSCIFLVEENGLGKEKSCRLTHNLLLFLP